MTQETPWGWVELGGRESGDKKGRSEGTRPDTRHKIRLVCVLSTFENNTGRTYGPTDRRTDATSYRDATAHLKTCMEKGEDKFGRREAGGFLGMKIIGRRTSEEMRGRGRRK